MIQWAHVATLVTTILPSRHSPTHSKLKYGRDRSKSKLAVFDKLSSSISMHIKMQGKRSNRASSRSWYYTNLLQHVDWGLSRHLNDILYTPCIEVDRSARESTIWSFWTWFLGEQSCDPESLFPKGKQSIAHGSRFPISVATRASSNPTARRRPPQHPPLYRPPRHCPRPEPRLRFDQDGTPKCFFPRRVTVRSRFWWNEREDIAATVTTFGRTTVSRSSRLWLRCCQPLKGPGSYNDG